MAVFNQDAGAYESVCKLGSGFDDAFLAEMPELLDPLKSETKPSDVIAEMEPDVWFEPGVVLEVIAAEISLSPIHTAASDLTEEGSGMALRFPRFTGKVRDDKGPEQASSSRELWSMYNAQTTRD